MSIVTRKLQNLRVMMRRDFKPLGIASRKFPFGLAFQLPGIVNRKLKNLWVLLPRNCSTFMYCYTEIVNFHVKFSEIDQKAKMLG